jgi:SAM-dependent methyltransferase
MLRPFGLTNLEAELYELTHRGNPGDRAFYAKSCAKARRVLELGAGYGRLIPDLSRSAAEIWGLERDAQLLAAARRVVLQLGPAQRRKVKLLGGDMRDFNLEQKFDRILLPYNGLYCLLNRRDILRCFKCVKRHLAPGGEFIFDVWSANRFYRDARSSAYRDEPGPILSIAHRSQIWDVFEKSRLRSRSQRLDVTYTYLSRERGTRVTIPIEQRYAPSSELIELVTSAGLQIKAVHGDFATHRFSRKSPHIVMRAT